MNTRATDLLDDDGYPQCSREFIKGALEKIKAELAVRVVETKISEANKKEVSYVVFEKIIEDCLRGIMSYRYEVTKDEGEMLFDIKKGNLIIHFSERTHPFNGYLTYYLIFSGSLDKFEKEFNMRNETRVLS